MDPGIIALIAVALVATLIFGLYLLGRQAVAAGVTESELDVARVLRWKFRHQTGPTTPAELPNQQAATIESEAAGTEARKLEYALTLVSEVAEGLVPAVEAADAWERRQRVASWLKIFIEGLGTSLAALGAEKYRAALWLKDGDEMVGIAYHLFDPATAPERLDQTSVAAYVARTGQPHYCPDVSQCGVYVPRDPSRTRRAYTSLYAVPLGPQDRPWGAITVDARRADGFAWVEKAIVLAFGRVVATGMGMFDIANDQIEAAGTAELMQEEWTKYLEGGGEPEVEPDDAGDQS